MQMWILHGRNYILLMYLFFIIEANHLRCTGLIRMNVAEPMKKVALSKAEREGGSGRPIVRWFSESWKFLTQAELTHKSCSYGFLGSY